MSKMSQIHAELCEQAYELGFESIEQAEANGYHIDYNGDGWKLKLDVAKAQEQAHEAWLKEKGEVLEELGRLHEGLIERGYDALAEMAKHAMEFVEKGEL